MAKENKYIRSLIKSAQFGNNAALEQLFEMNMGRIYALALRLMGNIPDAEKLTATIFISAWKNLKTIRADILFANWLMSLTVYNALEDLRKRRDSSIVQDKSKGNKNDDQLAQVADPLELEILKLPETERFVMVLHKIESYTVDEVSDLLSISGKETMARLDNASGRILKSLIEIQSTDELFHKLLNLTKVHTPAESVVDNIYDEVYHRRVEEAEKKRAAEEPPVVEKETEEDIEESEEKKKYREKKKKGIEKKEKAKTEKPEEKKEFKLKPSFDFKILKNLVLPLAVIAGVTALIIILFSGGDAWEVKIKKGSVVIDSEEIPGNTSLSAEKFILTTAESYASVFVPEFGEVNMDPLTSIQRLKEKNSIRLNVGTIRVMFSNQNETFRMLVHSASISDYSPGYSYELSMNEAGNSKLSLNDGWLRVKGSNYEVVSGPGNIVEIMSDRGCCLPYHFSADPIVIELVKQISFQSMESSILPLLENSGKKEALTLWNLFKTSGRGVRELIYTKLNSIVPHPTNISKNDLIGLDEEKLIAWLTEIQSKMNK